MNQSRTTGIALVLCGLATLIANLLNTEWQSPLRFVFVGLAILLVLVGFVTLARQRSD